MRHHNYFIFGPCDQRCSIIKSVYVYVADLISTKSGLGARLSAIQRVRPESEVIGKLKELRLQLIS